MHTQDNGYIENGEMKFKKIPWYKKLFAREPTKTECIGTTSFYSSWIWSNKEHKSESAVYRVFNPITNKTKSMYSVVEGRYFYYDVGAYEKFGKLVEGSKRLN